MCGKVALEDSMSVCPAVTWGEDFNQSISQLIVGQQETSAIAKRWVQLTHFCLSLLQVMAVTET